MNINNEESISVFKFEGTDEERAIAATKEFFNKEVLRSIKDNYERMQEEQKES